MQAQMSQVSIGGDWPISEIGCAMPIIATDAGLMWTMIEDDLEPLRIFIEQIAGNRAVDLFRTQSRDPDRRSVVGFGNAPDSPRRRPQARRRDQEQERRGQRLPRRQDQSRCRAVGGLSCRRQEVDRQECRRGRGLAQARPAIVSKRRLDRSSANTTSVRWSATAISASCGRTTWTAAARIPTRMSTPSCGTRPRKSASASGRFSPRPPITARP